MINDEELKYFLALWRTPALGHGVMRKLCEQFDDLSEIFQLSYKQLTQLGLSEQVASGIARPDWSGVNNDLAWAAQSGCQIITMTDKSYPSLLHESGMAPLLLFVQGDASVLSQPQLAIVGSRNPSASGLELADQFAKDIVRADLIVTSGMALGIDGAAHAGAIAANGNTIAVLGTGPDIIYPKCHQQLAEEIITNGAIVTEFPTGVKALPVHFPRRNRIVSGLSLGVLVIEASLRSGSLITARLAAEQSREVFALPGSIKHSLARGCHYLIRQGAKLVESADDIFAELGPLISAQHAQVIEKQEKITPPGLDTKAEKILKALDYAPTSIDTLVARTGLTVREIASMLLILELKGCISQSSNGYLRE